MLLSSAQVLPALSRHDAGKIQVKTSENIPLSTAGIDFPKWRNLPLHAPLYSGRNSLKLILIIPPNTKKRKKYFCPLDTIMHQFV